MNKQANNLDIICIVCPKGCHMCVDKDTGKVEGNGCKRGAEYGKTEALDPRRIITSTVKIKSKTGKSRCPVKLNKPIPKAKIMQAMAELEKIELVAPVKIGDVVKGNICGEDASFLVCKDIF